MATKESILTAALDLASEKGLGNVSLSQIAKKAGIQKASLYSHFSSKDEIITSLYEFLRKKAVEKVDPGGVDYGKLVKGRSMREILNMTVASYRTMNEDPDMVRFYRFITSECLLSKEAAGIMTAETDRMILATKQLFYAMQVQEIVRFTDIDAAAVSFAMTVHALMDREHIRKSAGLEADDMIETYIGEFSRIYGGEEA